MKKDNVDKGLKRQGTLAGLLLVIVAAATLEATALVQMYFSQKGIRQEATQKAESQLEATRLRITDIIDQTETAVRNSVWIAQWALYVPDSLQAVARRIVTENPVVVGSTVALVPGFDRKHPLFAPYCFQAPGDSTLQYSSLATADYDYPSQEWFRKPIELNAGYWSEPYIDVGGGNILMTTYSVPLHAADGRIAAVLTADISLDWLTSLVGGVQVYPNAFSMVFSRTGQVMVCPVDSFVMQRTVHELISEMDDSAAFRSINRSMLAGESGNASVKYRDGRSQVFYAPVEKTGWSMSIMIPDKDIYGNIRRIGLIVFIMQLIGIAMLVLILTSFAKNQSKYRELNERREKMENELKIARNIQMAMIPKVFPPFPERSDLDMSAMIVPAKEVGGDLYDFFIRDEKLFFCAGDVSGKGIPASIVMAVIRSLFRTLSERDDNPARILTVMNDSLSKGNDSNMFVTIFLGVLDLKTGQLHYCNAGHNPPIMLTDTKKALDVEANLPLGVMEGFPFKGQQASMLHDDAIFLFTDGLTEAENADHELFGDARVDEVLSTRRNSEQHLKAMQEAVAQFVGDAPQSDDLTMLFIHYLGKPDGAHRSLELKNDIQQIPQLAEFIDGIAEECSLDSSLATNLNLALEEAVTNVMLYAYPEGTEGQIGLEAVRLQNSLKFILSDAGTPFDPTEAPEADTSLSAEQRNIGGLGIFLVRKIMDNVQYERRGDRNILTMTKKI